MFITKLKKNSEGSVGNKRVKIVAKKAIIYIERKILCMKE